MATVDVLRVFTGTEQRGGNPLGVVLYGAQVPGPARQGLAGELGFSETVFLDDPEEGRVQIFTPRAELPFAGHPLVGTAWLLARMDQPTEVLRPPAGEVPTWADGHDRYWIRGRAEWAPAMTLRQYDSPAAVDALSGAPDEEPFVLAWAWEDDEAGMVRARVFAPVLGIDEDEATGAAAVRLVTLLDRPIEIHQGVGSVILARPGADGTAEIGGRCVHDETREHPVAQPLA